MSETAAFQNAPFQNIAVIGAGTMGSAIAGQVANAGYQVLLLDMPADDGDDPDARSRDAVQRLIESDPPALFSKSCAKRIQTGNIRDDLAALSACDWIIEAVVERLEVKKELYRQLDAVAAKDCVITSNTSTIPIRLLVEDMPLSFRKRFAITHYFNPVRYMRLLELVAGQDTDPAVIARLKAYNDRVLGKGVVQCRDTPGFLGNRVGVFALQVGLAEAFRRNLAIDIADAVAGRPMGIPKTGIFGLYDLIGIDLMADVVKTLGTILPEDDAFHEFGETLNPVAPVIRQMLADGHKGDKTGGGFYRKGKESGRLDLKTGAILKRSQAMPPVVMKANAMLAAGDDPLPLMVSATDDPADEPVIGFARAVLARVFAYAASLIPSVTETPQAIDDAMKLGFNWQRGPFEMMDMIGHETVSAMLTETGLEPPPLLRSKGGAFYQPSAKGLLVERFAADGSSLGHGAVELPDGVVRFHLLRRCLEPIRRNEAASLYRIGENYRLVEFHSKANALTDSSMEMVAVAAEDHGRGIIIHNDAQHFSAGVDLTAVLALIRERDWDGIEAFLVRFQRAVSALRDAPVPVVVAPSGLAIGGGFEVVLHADQVIAHGNSVFGLVESAVGLVPGGGGIKETMRRWLTSGPDAGKAAWQSWMQIGYARIGTSPEESAKLNYFLPPRDRMEMNRDRLVCAAEAAIEAMHERSYTPPASPVLSLPGNGLKERMASFMDKGIGEGIFYPHDKTVAMAIASVIVSDGAEDVTISEEEAFVRERQAFLSLAGTRETEERITMLMEHGKSIRN